MLEATASLSVKQEIMLGTLKMAFKIKNGLVPAYLSGACRKNKDTHGYQLRDNEDFRLPLFRKDNTQRMLMYNGLKEFNKLPHEIKSDNELTSFVKKAKQFVKSYL